MSKLYYDIPIEEEYETEESYEFFEQNLPHEEILREWLPQEWAKCHVENTFDEILKGKVTSTDMKCRKTPDGRLIARVTVEFVPGFRLSEQRRDACWEQLDAQMTDGWGESMDHEQIPGAPEGYFVKL